MAISPQKQLNPPAPLKEVLMAQGAFGMPALGNQSRPWDTQGNITAARDETFNNLRGVSAPRPMSNPFAPPPTGSTGGLLPMQGSESEARALAQNTATKAMFNGAGMATVVPAAPAGAVDAALGGVVNPFATPGLAPGMSAAMGVEGMRRGIEAERFNRLNVAPFMATLQQPGVSPEVASSRLGYFDKLALREAGMPADRAPNPVYRGVDATGNLTLANQEMDAGGRPVINLNKPGRTTELDQNRQAVQGLAAEGARSLQSSQPLETEVVESGDDRITLNKRTGEVIARAPRTPLPAGYERAPDGGIQPIAGSREAVERGDAAKADTEKRQQAIEKGMEVVNTIGRALERTGYFNQATGFIPFTPGADLSNLIDTIKANIGFKELADMRAASPTGGALGQVAVKELDFLQAARGSLDRKQSPEQLQKNLEQIRASYNRWLKAYQGINPDEGGAIDLPAQARAILEARKAKSGQKKQ